MKRFAYFNRTFVVKPENFHLAGMERFSTFFKIFKSGTVPIDRSGIISLPLATASLFPLPKIRPFSKTYETLCNERAIELLTRADTLGCPLYVSWSGGIDSTLVLVSLLKHASVAQKKKMAVLMSEDSIAENPRFYEDHIRGKLRRDSSLMFPHLLGTNSLFVSGELNDQLFGAELSGQLIKRFGETIVHKPYSRDIFMSFMAEKLGMEKEGLVAFYVDLFERLAAKAPITLTSNHDIIWWFNFCAHWQGTFMRTLLYAADRNKELITASYVATHYAPFYVTEEFQLWSMLNLDKKIRDSWETYKWPAKDIIYEYTKDADYRDHKTKHSSLFSVLIGHVPFHYIDESFRLMRTCNLEAYYNAGNDFV